MSDGKLHLEIAADLDGDGHEAADYNEYGSVVIAGYRIEASNRADTARVSCPTPGPGRGTALAAGAVSAYAATLRRAGNDVVEREGMSAPYLLVTPKAGV